MSVVPSSGWETLYGTWEGPTHTPPSVRGTRVRVEWPKKTSAWITQVYLGWGTAMSYTENQVAVCGALFLDEGGSPAPCKLKQIKLVLSTGQTDPVTLVARKFGTSDYAATLTVGAGSTEATWTGVVADVTDLMWRLTTTAGALIAADFAVTTWVEP